MQPFAMTLSCLRTALLLLSGLPAVRPDGDAFSFDGVRQLLDLQLGAEAPRPLDRAARRTPARSSNLTGAMCDAMLSDPSHLFARFWAAQGWAPSGPGRGAHIESAAPLCWEVSRGAPAAAGVEDSLSLDTFMSRVHSRDLCHLRWNAADESSSADASPNPAVLGFDEDIYGFCTSRAHALANATNATDAANAFASLLDLQNARVACPFAGFEMLVLLGEDYNACRNLEWIACAASGSLRNQQHGGGIVFATIPSHLDPTGANGGRPLGQCGGFVPQHPVVGSRDQEGRQRGPTPLDDGVGYTGHDIFYLEICLLNAICKNASAMWEMKVGDIFHCHPSAERLADLRQTLLAKAPHPPPATAAWCVRKTERLVEGAIPEGSDDAFLYTAGRLFVRPGLHNVVLNNSAGTWGGTCACPDGAMYQAGDEDNACQMRGRLESLVPPARGPLVSQARPLPRDAGCCAGC